MAADFWRRTYHRVLGSEAPALRRAVVVLIVALVATSVLLIRVRWELAVILGWDAGAVTFLTGTLNLIVRATGTDTERLAAKEDTTRTAAALILVGISTASLLGVGFTIHLAADSSGWRRFALIAIAVITVTVSWTTLNVMYVFRYAYLFYGPASGGIEFGDPETQARPSYRDLAYMAFTIGMTYQVSDTALRSPQTRRTVLSHAALAYVFGVVIVAGAVNVIASLTH